MLHFAAGQDMLECERLVDEGKAERVLQGRAFDLRLTFDFADSPDFPVLERQPNMVTWGTVYEVPAELLGVASEDYQELEVTSWDDTSRTCFARIRDRYQPEVLPPVSLLEALKEHVESVEEFPAGFRQFIGDLADGLIPTGENTLLVSGHRETGRPLHYSRVRLNSVDARRLNLDGSHSAVAVYGARTCPVGVETVNSCAPGVCQLNQTARAALGMEGRRSYGQRMALFPLIGELEAPRLVQPRSLSLQLYRPARVDSEKNIVVLHDKNLQLLGVNPGDFVRLRVAVQRSGSSVPEYELRSHSLRAYPGLASEVRRGNEKIEYPMVTEVYVDAYGRGDLGLGHDAQGVIAVVTADVWRLFLSRSVYYGGTLLLSLIALQALADAVGSVLAPIMAAAITLVVTLFDLRGRIQF